MVITSASHAEGRRFEPCQRHIFVFTFEDKLFLANFFSCFILFCFILGKIRSSKFFFKLFFFKIVFFKIVFFFNFFFFKFFFYCINQTHSFYWKKIVGKAANRDIKPKMTSSDTDKRWCLSSPKSNWLAFWNDAKNGQRALFKRSLWRFQSFFQFYSQGMIPINISMNMWRS